MDLIYMNKDKEDVGTLQKYEVDLAFGSDENDFECKINKENHCCEEGWFLYVENTEYGGIIDSIEVSTEEEYVTYKGRSWHGMLEGKVICPENGQDYAVFEGDANEVLAEIIQSVGLSDIFESSTEDSGIDIFAYKMDRYVHAYTGIRKMLFDFGGKLNIVFRKGKVVLSATPYINYGEDEEWDESQVNFKITRNYRPVNHLICLGKGDLKDRAVIHLFTDEYGSIQPYTSAETPLQDSDYILDTSKQVIFGNEEVCEIYDYPNAESIENYIPLEEEPSDFKKNFMNYYEQDNQRFYALESHLEDFYVLQGSQPSDWNTKYGSYYVLKNGKYETVSSVYETVYNLQTSQPADWAYNYGEYYYLNGSSYSTAKEVTTASYAKQTSKPSDWSTNYGNYFYYYSDGVTSEYRKVSGDVKYKKVLQTTKPSDWSKNFKSYYKKSGKKYISVPPKSNGKAPTWKKNTYYTQQSYYVAPKWEKNKYYTEYITVSPPTWEANKYYTKSIKTVPTWESGKYYTKTVITVIPTFIKNHVYKKVIDNYAVLVEYGVQKLQESYNCDSIEIDIDTENTYDVGDIVGATERVTGIGVWQPITKKIVTIKNNDVSSISYKIGE